MPYREPAPDEEAKRDAAEVEAFGQEIGRQQATGRRRAALACVAGLAFALGAAWLALWLRGPTAPPARPCRTVHRITVIDGKATRTPEVVCDVGVVSTARLTIGNSHFEENDAATAPGYRSPRLRAPRGVACGPCSRGLMERGDGFTG